MLTAATVRKREQFIHFVDLKFKDEAAVQAVFVVGSVAAGTAREGSDIDAVIFLDPLDLYLVPAESIWREADDTFHTIFEEDEELDRNGLQLEFKRLDWKLWRDPAHEWPEPLRAQLSGAWRAFERTGEVAAVVADRVRYSDEARLARLDDALVRLDQNLAEGRPERVWDSLGETVAHDRLHAAYGYLVQALFAYNRQWRIWRDREMTALLQLAWLPDGFNDHLLTAINAPSHDRAGYDTRVVSLRTLYQEILARLIADSLYGADAISEAFIRNHDEPGRAWNMERWNEMHRTRR